MNVKIEDLTPEMQIKVRSFLSLIQIPYVVTSTRRTQDEQIALYLQGRTPLPIVNLLRKKAGLPAIDERGNAGTVTNCDGIDKQSSHQDGTAIDVVPANANGNPIWPYPSDPRWAKIGTAGEAAGLEWGGRWEKFPDFPHYQLKES